MHICSYVIIMKVKVESKQRKSEKIKAYDGHSGKLHNYHIKKVSTCHFMHYIIDNITF
jgi:hypothetical protein